jgi:hypothetical protein
MTPPTLRAPIFQLDSFTTTRFAGNPAAVVVLEQFLPDASMQAIAAETWSARNRILRPARACITRASRKRFVPLVARSAPLIRWRC